MIVAPVKALISAVSDDGRTKVSSPTKSMSTSDRLLNVLGLFTMERPEWTVEDAARELDLALSTPYRYFKSLSDVGLIVAYSAGRYVLGPAIIQYDRLMRLLDPLITTAQSVMAQLVVSMPPQHMMLLCRLYRTQVMCVHQEFNERPDFAVSYERGRPMPLFRGAGSKIILAHLPSRIVKGIYDTNSAQIKEASLGASWDETKRFLRDIRTAGISITESELDRGMRGISVPIFGPDADIMGSLSIVAPLKYDKKFGIEAAGNVLNLGRRQIEAGLTLLAAKDRAERAAAVG